MGSKRVVIWGAGGCVGRSFTRRLAAEGFDIKAVVRDVEKASFLKTMGEVGQIAILPAGPQTPWRMRELMDGCTYVVNAVGILGESRAQNFAGVHVHLPKLIAETAARVGALRMVHISSIAADRTSESRYASTKGEGEEKVLSAFSKATILRPSLIFGEHAKFFADFGSWASLSPLIFLPGDGKTLFQPVSVDDVVSAGFAAFETNKMGGRIYELGGPDILTLHELLSLLLKTMNRRNTLVPLPFSMARALSTITQFLPNPPLTPDTVKLLRHNAVAHEGALGFRDIGITPKALSPELSRILKRFIKS